jgi:hypothetical protein
MMNPASRYPESRTALAKLAKITSLGANHATPDAQLEAIMDTILKVGVTTWAVWLKEGGLGTPHSQPKGRARHRRRRHSAGSL